MGNICNVWAKSIVIMRSINTILWSYLRHIFSCMAIPTSLSCAASLLLCVIDLIIMLYVVVQVTAWCDRASKFHDVCTCVSEMFSRLTAIPNRSLLYDIYQYTWDAKEATMLLDSYIAWLGTLNMYMYAIALFRRRL